MKLSSNGRWSLACVVSIALMLGVSGCGNGTIGYLWVLAGQSSSNTVGNVITGYKIDDNTGNLTEIVHSPFTAGAGGTGAPQYSVVVPGGRYLYTVNLNEPTNSVVLFSVGGDGVLAAQQEYGTVGATPAWFDLGSGFLYVLDRISPARDASGKAPACTSPTMANNTARLSGSLRGGLGHGPADAGAEQHHQGGQQGDCVFPGGAEPVAPQGGGRQRRGLER